MNNPLTQKADKWQYPPGWGDEVIRVMFKINGAKTWNYLSDDGIKRAKELGYHAEER